MRTIIPVAIAEVLYVAAVVLGWKWWTLRKHLKKGGRL